MKKLVTFGEIMMRLTPEGCHRFQRTDRYICYYGGSEANAAATAAELGVRASFVTRLPENGLGDGAICALQGFGVGTEAVVRGGERIGLYFLENGTDQRPAKVIYDRADSAMAKAKAADFDWNRILDDADWFHFSGITPSLGPEMAKATMEACRTAREKGLTISCDLNYRSKMWSPAEARAVMDDILPFVDVFIANDKDVLGMYDNLTWKSADPGERSSEMLKAMTGRFHFRKAAMVLVDQKPGRQAVWGTLLADGRLVQSKAYRAQMVESVGAGDTFAGAVIAAELKGMSAENEVNYAAAASSLKFSVPGDMNVITEDDVLGLMNRTGEDWVSR